MTEAEEKKPGTFIITQYLHLAPHQMSSFKNR